MPIPIKVATLIVLAAVAAMPDCGTPLEERRSNRQKATAGSPQAPSTLSTARGAAEAARQYRKMFLTINESKLDRLSRSTDLTLSVHAFWERQMRRANAAGSRKKAATVRVKNARREIARFVGFLEGRSRISVPSWWESSVLDSDTLSPPVKRKEVSYRKALKFGEEDGRRFGRVRLGISLARDGPFVEVTVDKRKIRVPFKLFEDHLESDFDAQVAGGIVYMIFPRLVAGLEYPVIAFDVKLRKILWKTTVWSGNDHGPGVGATDHFVAVSLQLHFLKKHRTLPG